MENEDEDSYGSFFERGSFKYARAEEKLDKKNILKVYVFQKIVSQGGDINGYIVLKANTKLPEGKIFLRIETITETNLDHTKQPVSIDDEVKQLHQNLLNNEGNAIP